MVKNKNTAGRCGRCARPDAGRVLLHGIRSGWWSDSSESWRRGWMEISKARKFASGSSIPRFSPPSRPTPHAARSIRCMTRLRRSAASCRCSTFSSAKLSSAASARDSTGCSLVVLAASSPVSWSAARRSICKKIESYDVKVAMLALLILAISHPGLRGLGVGKQMGRASP